MDFRKTLPPPDNWTVRESKVAEFDLGGVKVAQEECKVGLHAEEEPDMVCESDGGEDGERVRLLLRPRTLSKAEWERHVLSHLTFRDRCRHCVAGRGLEHQYQHHLGTMINIHLCALITGVCAEMLHRCWSRRLDEQEWSLLSLC